jgi:phosphopantothenoylcysteine decarboxylase/phosphopantothenate--cysteine ligase
MSTVLLGVSGGIAAYKAVELLRRLTEAGHHVRVVPTEAALDFVGAATWEALSGQPVDTQVLARTHSVQHVQLARQADLMLVAPATADTLSRAVAGRADDLLTACLLTTTSPVVFAPAMHTQMWQHRATAANVATLRARGAVVIDPDSGRLTGPDSGPGRLPEPDELAAVTETVLQRPAVAGAAAGRDLAGLHVVVTAGGTREPLDPVRFLGNSSSGRMGWALARAATLRGASVDLVAANVDLPAPSGVTIHPVTSTQELAEGTRKVAAGADVVVMAAAPSDFRPAQAQPGKIKKSASGEGMHLSLVQNPDILAELAADRSPTGATLVGFAAETADDPGQLIELGRAKLAAKGCDLLVLNAVGQQKVFGQSDSEIRLLHAGDSASEFPEPLSGSKDVLAHQVWDDVHRTRRTR